MRRTDIHFVCVEGKRIAINQLELKTSESSNSDYSTRDCDKWKRQEEGLKNEEDIVESGRIFIRNLPYSCTEDELQKVFEKFGAFFYCCVFFFEEYY